MINTKNPIIIATGVIALLLIVIVFFGTRGKPDDNIIACTMEAKICPDGSAVGRVGPTCEFAKCPEVKVQKSGIEGTVMLGPICPVMRDPPQEECKDKPFETQLALTTVDGTQKILAFNSDSNGKFSIEIAAGEYAISSSDATKMFPRCVSNGIIKVVENSVAKVEINCDTGIR
ncbi:hypothetical protein HY989_07100 [Candidatus Micrarchaeota archaeon]|nr:hypothetical protein [Candidatus Micrarchaeota archaeon]